MQLRGRGEEGVAGKIIILVAALFALASCGREPLHQSQSYVFGTLVDVAIYGESEERSQMLTSHVLQEFQRLHHSLHAWQPSELSLLNAAFAQGEKAPVAPELAAIIGDATQISEKSGGLFNPAIGGLIELWGFQRSEFTPVRPDLQQLAALVKANPRMTDIAIGGGQASSNNPAVKLDLGGYAKGYALDRAATYLHGEKVRGALINIGGNIIAIGRRGDRPWRVGIQHPRKPGPIATVDLEDGWAIGTSGDYQRYFELDGKRYCHIIDPRTGYPVQDVQAVTVLVPPSANAGTMSDAASKPIFISGPEGWRKAAAEMGIDHAMLIDGQGKIHLTQALQQKLQFTEKHVPLEILP